jgi:hypothetical protein
VGTYREAKREGNGGKNAAKTIDVKPGRKDDQKTVRKLEHQLFDEVAIRVRQEYHTSILQIPNA